MLTRNLIKIIILSSICVFLLNCKSEEIILHGNIKGIVTDAETGAPIEHAMVVVNPSNDTAFTENDGAYLLKNISPGEYAMQASKFSYNTSLKNIELEEKETEEVNFALNGIPIPQFSDTVLNFELETASLTFTISNIGKGKLTYFFTAADWINFSPSGGYVTDETDIITITIDRSGLYDTILYHEPVRVISDFRTDTVDVIVNGFMYEGQVYKIVKIGTQTWMAENLNAGKKIETSDYNVQNNNDVIEKYCYENSPCNIYGGLYEWNEMMQYNPPDDKLTGTTKGICPYGWHIPTLNEWIILINYLGGDKEAVGKLKEKGTEHWLAPNDGATNESGFTALPGGGYYKVNYYDKKNQFASIGTTGLFWTATQSDYDQSSRYRIEIRDPHSGISRNNRGLLMDALSVRCLKNP
jgi:uncharacterized protein (TIGR02145 family)